MAKEIPYRGHAWGRVGRGTMAGVKHRGVPTSILVRLSGMWQVILMARLWPWLRRPRHRQRSLAPTVRRQSALSV